MTKPITKPMTFDGEKMREMNHAEITQYELDNAENLKREKATQAEATAKADARTSALNKLSALGLTQEEIDSL